MKTQSKPKAPKAFNSNEVLNGEYFVEKIIGKRIAKGEIKYHVKWLGWPSSSNTWEPIDHLAGSERIIEAFESDGNNKTQRRKKRRGSGRVSHSASPTKKATLESRKTIDIGVEGVTVSLPFFTKAPDGKVPQIMGITKYKELLVWVCYWKDKSNPGNSESEVSEQVLLEQKLLDICAFDGAAMNADYPQKAIAYFQKRLQFGDVHEPTRDANTTIEQVDLTGTDPSEVGGIEELNERKDQEEQIIGGNPIYPIATITPDEEVHIEASGDDASFISFTENDNLVDLDLSPEKPLEQVRMIQVRDNYSSDSEDLFQDVALYANIIQQGEDGDNHSLTHSLDLPEMDFSCLVEDDMNLI